MPYLDTHLTPDDSWVNKYTGVKFPHDAYVKDPDKLAQLSGPVTTYYLDGGVNKYEQIRRSHE